MSPDESRLELLIRNVSVYRNIISNHDKYAPIAILIIAINHVYKLTYVSKELRTGRFKEQGIQNC
ncbi:hypothetical protein G3569_02205 [Aliifodinibius halophilus]|uniref:Uncharacterized protein n=1 Tax=Fodinibius halophilus TaxID=1736908 RepID=A0A6M1T7Q1_9BACT|nr:hypothetical protein [Fodinibius halophilus]